MGEKLDKKEESNVIQIDKRRVEKLETNGHYFSMLEQFETLHAKFFYTSEMDKKEAINFVTLCRYFEKNGHSEALRLRCKFLLEKYVEGKEL